MFPFLNVKTGEGKETKEELISGPGGWDSKRPPTRFQLWYPSQFFKQGDLVYIVFIQSFVMKILLVFFLSILFSLMASPEESLNNLQVLLQDDSFLFQAAEVTQITSLVFEGIRREIYRRWCISLKMKEKWKPTLWLQRLDF